MQAPTPSSDPRPDERDAAAAARAADARDGGASGASAHAAASETAGDASSAAAPLAGAQRRAEPRRVGYAQEGSWGAISERHWTRTRRDANSEALEYYRERSRAPGVREGGAERNFYCMQCDGVIPYSETVERCPHCDARVERGVKRYFNWVEMEMPRGSDLPRALLPLVALCALGALALWWVGCGPSGA
jgi:hypothetical protein